MKQMLDSFIREELKNFHLAQENYKALSGVIERTIEMDEYSFILQFNPQRIRSSTARTDIQTIRERKCFLCKENRPAEQKSIHYPLGYEILLNPYPIFPLHLTVPDCSHVEQHISEKMADMLNLAKDFPDFVIFYNGPQSGASAPDHMHFQMSGKGFLPLERDIKGFPGKKVWKETASGSFYSMEHYTRKMLLLESKDKEYLLMVWKKILSSLKKVQPDYPEPMLNILVLYNERGWNICIFPRIKHRPKQYYASGEEQVLFSPGAVDMAGLMVFSRKEDFEKMNKDLIIDMLSQVTFTNRMWNKLKDNLIQ